MSFLHIFNELGDTQVEGTSREGEPRRTANFAALFAALGAVYDSAFVPQSILSQIDAPQNEELEQKNEE